MMPQIKRFLPVFVVLTAVLMVGVPTLAQDDLIETSNPVPSEKMLDGLMMVHQDTNRCSAAALTIQLSFFDEFELTYTDVTRRLNPYGGDVSVRIEEMATVAEENGLKAVVRRGGTIDLLKALIANDFPVLIENVYFDGPNGWDDWMSHNRVAVGYNDALQTMYFFDPLLGNGQDGRGRPMSYEEVNSRWRAFNYDFLVVYSAEDEGRLVSTLGPEYWDETLNAELTLQMAEAELAGPNADSFALFNKGWALLQLERYEESAEAFDQAIGLGLPWRMHWYEFGAFEAYLATGRYDDVINEVYRVLQTTDGVEEMYYYIAQAYAGKNDIQRAIANLDAALYRNRFFTEASDLMSEYQEMVSAN